MSCISLNELAERWGYAPDTIYKGLKNNPEKWPPYSQVGKKTKILFDISDVELFEKKIKNKKVRKNPKKS